MSTDADLRALAALVEVRGIAVRAAEQAFADARADAAAAEAEAHAAEARRAALEVRHLAERARAASALTCGAAFAAFELADRDRRTALAAQVELVCGAHERLERAEARREVARVALAHAAAEEHAAREVHAARLARVRAAREAAAEEEAAEVAAGLPRGGRRNLDGPDRRT